MARTPSSPPQDASASRGVAADGDAAQTTFSEDTSKATAGTSRKGKVAAGVAVAAVAVAAGSAVVASRRRSQASEQPTHIDTSFEVKPTGNTAVDEIMEASQRLLSGGAGLR